MATKTKSPNIPAKGVDVLHLGERVNTKWATENWLTLQYITQPNFDLKVQALSTVLTKRNITGSGRRHETAVLKELDKEIDKGVSQVKKYIIGKFPNEDPTAYYPQFGIEHYITSTNSSWIFPADRDQRLENLDLMIGAITTFGFDGNTYGLAFWTGLKTSYTTAINDARDTDSSVSGDVGDKNVLIKEIKVVLVSILDVIKGNFPETYHNVWREFGYLKEEN